MISRRLIQCTASMLAILIAMIAITGYMTGITRLYIPMDSISGINMVGMAPNTALAIIFLGIAGIAGSLQGTRTK